MTFIIRYKISLMFVVGVVCVFILIGSNSLSDRYFISAIGALITLYIGLTQYQLSNDKIFKDLFKDFNQKYNNDFNDLINNLSNKEGTRSLEEEEVALIIDYINLSAEEYLWYKKGRIPKDVWKAWRNGIIANLEISEVYEVASNEYNKFKNSYYGLFEELKFEPKNDI